MKLAQGHYKTVFSSASFLKKKPNHQKKAKQAECVSE